VSFKKKLKQHEKHHVREKLTWMIVGEGGKKVSDGNKLQKKL